MGDAIEVLNDITDDFDIIFIDAAKGQYKQFFDLCLKNTHKGSIIISDNILYKGITASDDFLSGRRNKTIMRRMREYIKYITNLEDVQTSILPVGDGVAITVIK
jgi:predicted O-methyltransferase YrrM